jgi:hypothetical protein
MVWGGDAPTGAGGLESRIHKVSIMFSNLNLLTDLNLLRYI